MDNAIASVTPAESAAAAEIPADDAVEVETETADSDTDSAAPTSENLDDQPAEDGDDGEPADDAESADGDEVSTADPEAIPTAEEINARYDRVPKQARTEMIGLADRLRTTTEAVNAIGGEKGAEVLRPLADILAKAETTLEERVSAISSLIQANDTVAWSIGQDFAHAMFEAPEFRAIGDQVALSVFGSSVVDLAGYAQLKTKFGESVTTEHLGKLLTLEQAGYLNADEDMETFTSQFGGSDPGGSQH